MQLNFKDMDVKIRKFKLKDGNVVMCGERDFDGEFIHRNDMELLIHLLKDDLAMLKRDCENRKDDEFSKKQLYAIDCETRMLDKILDKITRYV